MSSYVKWAAALAVLGGGAAAWYYGGPDGAELYRRALDVLAPAVAQ